MPVNNILGTYEGKCCDADVVNNNGMFLNRELFENLLNSDEYKTAIKNRYYIGFLGHPEDPNCMDFRNACIIMTSMEMDDNGDILGSFDLVDTPVGRVVKAFKDAGVNFGISIRGAGDVAPDGTVDPDTFVFRGFDLVTFPAYNDCVPEFREIAASTDVESQKKYRKVCNAVKKNLKSINSCEAIEVLQDQFNENSQEYKMLEERATELKDQMNDDIYMEVLEQKVKGLTKAYMNKVRECKKHHDHACEMESLANKFEHENKKMDRMVHIASDQAVECSKQMRGMKKANDDLKKRVDASSVTASNAMSRAKQLSKENKELKDKNKQLVQASNKLKKDIESVEASHKSIVETNLISDKKVEASKSLIRSKDESIHSLEARLRETVAENERLKEEVSNREADVDELNSSIEACKQLIFQYQKAYADECAYAVGIRLDSVPVTSSTTVDELRSYIYSRASLGVSSVKASTNVEVEDTLDDMEDDDTEASSGLITL